jgi:adenylosuccinate lyase
LSIHPIDYRYGSHEIKRIFSKTNWLKLFIDVEIAILKALEKEGRIPDGVSDEIKRLVKGLKIEDINKWENRVKHESMAVILAMYEKSEEYGKYIHLGATSNDILDTIMGIQIRDAGNIILDKLDELIRQMISLAWRERLTPCLGRTHGRAAIPITFGFKLLLFLDQLDRVRTALTNAIKLCSIGKYSGAVGSGVEIEVIDGAHIEDEVMEILGITRARHATQIIPRDRYAYLFSSFSILSSILDQFGREIRNLQRSGIEEVMEPFVENQIGSSVMPQKRNPILSEKICGLSKVIRGFSLGWLENIIIEHERDLTNSSFERIAIPEVFILIDEQIMTATEIVKGLIIKKDNMIKNIRKEEPWIYSDLLVQIVAIRGGDRQKAHHRLREIISSRGSFEDILHDNYLSKYLKENDLEIPILLDKCISAAKIKTEKFLKELSKKYGVPLRN